MENKNKEIFSINDYRDIIKRRQLQLKNTLGKHYTLANLADEIQVQRPYLSKVVSKHADLSDDQLFLAIQFLKFNFNESHYIRLLHQYQRSGIRSRKEKIKHEIEEYKKKLLNADEHLNSIIDKKSPNLEKYFLNPNVQLVHMFLTIEVFRKDYKKIAAYLDLSIPDVETILEDLIQLNLIKIDDTSIEIQKEHLFLPKSSSLFQAHHLMSKINAQNKLNKVPKDKKNEVSTIFTCNEETTDKIRLELVEFLKKVEKLVTEDQHPTEVFQLNLDLFPWS